jgi:hypothetical protein
MDKKPRKKTGGRVPGSKNKRTLIGKDVAETLKNWLGFDNESVERTGMIDGDGYRGRLALKAMWDDQRPVDPQYVALAKFLFGYAYGTPGKHQQEGVQRETLVFSTSHGYLPWDSRAPAAAALNARSVLMIEGRPRRSSSRPRRARPRPPPPRTTRRRATRSPTSRS